jgi:hypothetical protein
VILPLILIPKYKSNSEKITLLAYKLNFCHIRTLFCDILNVFFAGMLAELPHTSTCFISCWKKERQAEVKEVWGVISFDV